VAVDGRRAYHRAGTHLEILDAANPAHLERLGRTPPLSRDAPASGDVVVSRGIVALSTADGVLLVDARDPRAPEELAWLELQGSVRRLVANDHLVAALVSVDEFGPAGVQIIDLADPDTPRLAGFVELIGIASNVWLADDVLWTYSSPPSSTREAHTTASQLRRLDVSDPDQPREIPIADPGTRYRDDEVWAMTLVGNTLYQVVDLDPPNPGADDEYVRYRSVRVLGVHPTHPEVEDRGEWRADAGSGWSSFGTLLWDSLLAQVVGHRLVVSSSRTGVFGDGQLLSLFDVSDPGAPLPLPDLEQSLAQPTCEQTGAPAVSGSLIWLPCADGLRVLDLDRAANSYQVGYYRPAELPRRPRRSRQPVFVGDTLWVVDDAPSTTDDDTSVRTRLDGWNVAGPGEPVLAGSRYLPWSVETMATDGRYLYVVGTQWGDVRVVDVRDPAHPVEVARLDRSEERSLCQGTGRNQPCAAQGPNASAVRYGKLLIAYQTGVGIGDIEVIDVRDPTHPVEETWIDGFRTTDVAFGDKLVWQLGYMGPVPSAFDLSQLGTGDTEPREVTGLSGLWDSGVEGSCLGTQGDRAFLAQTLDGSAGRVSGSGGGPPTLAIRALGRDGAGGVQVTSAITLSQQAHHPNNRSSCGMFVGGNRVLLTVYGGGWGEPDQHYVLDIADPDQLRLMAAERGGVWPSPFALRDGMLYELSDSGLTRWLLEPDTATSSATAEPRSWAPSGAG
jgi:hypothetical protein